MSLLTILQNNIANIVLIVVVIQIVITYNRQTETPDIELPIETLDAIGRAKSFSCKEELKQAAIKQSRNDLFLSHLKRSCPLDSSGSRYQRLGCLAGSRLNQRPIPLEEPIDDLSTCLGSCFSYGHKYGGFRSDPRGDIRCFCHDSGDILDDHSPLEATCNGSQIEWFRVNVGVHYASFGGDGKQLVNLTAPATQADVRLAFLLSFNGRSVLQIRRLLKNIFSPTHLYYIHVDNREQYLFEDLLPLELEHTNIVLTRHRFNTTWGGTSLLHMMIDAMGRLRHHQWDYLINLSESDFPIKSLKTLEHFLAANYGATFLRAHNMRGYRFIKKQGLTWNFYQCDNRLWRIGKRQLPSDIIYSGGSDWYALPKDFCDFIGEHANDESSLVGPLLQLFNFTLLPAESFFHTLALNSKFCDRFANNNLRLTNWHRKQGCKCQHRDVVDWCGCSPLVYRRADWNRLLATNASDSLFFSRKFDPTISSSIISAVEKQLVQASRPTVDPGEHDTRYWLNVHHDATDHSLPNFARQALELVTHLPGSVSNLFQLQKDSVYLYFNEDRFVGLVLVFCAPSSKTTATSCIQVLVGRNPDAHLEKVDQQSCFGPESSHALGSIEVNHNFDTSERIFRNYLPLSSRADLVVYHEWRPQATGCTANSLLPNRQMQFNWISPSGTRALTQNVRLRSDLKSSVLSLVHRMNVTRREMSAGEWTLSITSNSKTCLEYKFLVFDAEEYGNTHLARAALFNRYHKIIGICRNEDCTIDDHCRELPSCGSEHNWTLEAMRTVSQSYDLF